jgi:hypothetical protein
MKKIELSGKRGKGKFTLVDDDVYSLISAHKWYYMKNKSGNQYAYGIIDGKQILLHRLIKTPTRGKVIDHVDHNGLNNTRENLRICSFQQNTRYKQKSGKPKGAYPLKTKSGTRWRSYITLDGVTTYVGTYSTQKEAAEAYNNAANKYFKEFAKLNKV